MSSPTSVQCQQVHYIVMVEGISGIHIIPYTIHCLSYEMSVFTGLKSTWQIFRSSQESMLPLVTWRHSKWHTPPNNPIALMNCEALSSYDKIMSISC